MFERNYGFTRDTTGQPVRITLVDGGLQTGRLQLARNMRLEDALNGAGIFLSIKDDDGRTACLSKQAIRSVEAIEEPGTNLLEAKSRNLAALDPHAVLGVEKSAGSSEIHIAYRKLAKTYHPDRFAGLDLPEEIFDYVKAVSKRINAAYSDLQAQTPKDWQPMQYKAG